VSIVEPKDLRHEVTVVRGGRPDAPMLDAIERAVRSVLAGVGVAPSESASAWRRAGRIEAAGALRIDTRTALHRATRR
jgi:hypothetical protein